MKTNEVTDFRTDGVFMFVGTKPISDFAKGVVEMDQKGYIKADEEMRTSVEGIFAAGAVSYTHLRAHETVLDLVCRLLLEKKKTKHQQIRVME